ncbi:MAG TPA: Ig-like domain-containing protein [Armatimonadota bacterium]|nr:Ig-like domain-containing protein [Armatimonadota bacterium]
MRVLTLTMAALALLGAPVTASAQGRVKVARIVISPSGATLNPTDRVQFTATALDKRGNPVPGVVPTWKSSNSSVASVGNTGDVTASGQTGVAIISARAGQKRAKVTVSVVTRPSGGQPAVVAANLKQVNHVLVDGGFVYWTETDGQLTRVRRTPKAGGVIIDIASERAQGERGTTATYVHLQKFGDLVYWSRLSRGLLDHWSILSVSQDGGPVREILPEDAGIRKMFTNGWRLAGKYVVVAFTAPKEVNLGPNVRLGAFDTETGTWAPLIIGQFPFGLVHIIAADEQSVFVRAETEESNTVVLRLSPAGAANSYETLLTQEGRDDYLVRAGDTDGTNVYYWSRRGEDDRLVSLPVTGGRPTPQNATFGPGLTVENGSLYFSRADRAVVRVPVAGGPLTVVQNKLYGASAEGGIAVDDSGAYIAVLTSERTIDIVRVNR